MINKLSMKKQKKQNMQAWIPKNLEISNPKSRLLRKVYFRSIQQISRNEENYNRN